MQETNQLQKGHVSSLSHASSKKKQVQKLKIKFNAAKASLNSENPIRVQ